jgi:hypothetical protein
VLNGGRQSGLPTVLLDAGHGASQRAGGNAFFWVLMTSRWYILPKLLDYFTNWDKSYGSARANYL